MAHSYNFSYLRRLRSGGLRFEVSPGKIVHKTLSPKIFREK
jgi:hypothetical protein